MKKRPFLLFALGLLLGLGSRAYATCSSPCVQETAISRVVGGASPTPTFLSTPTIGHLAVVGVTLSNGSATVTVAGGAAAAWSLAGDSGSAGTTGSRAYIWCGVITSATTTVPTISVSGGGSAAEMIELSAPHGCGVGRIT